MLPLYVNERKKNKLGIFFLNVLSLFLNNGDLKKNKRSYGWLNFNYIFF